MNASGCTPSCAAVTAGLDDSLSAAHGAQSLADALSILKQLGVTDRGVFDGILRSILENHQLYLGSWSVWEPNALDGRDHEYINSRGHDDTGRYIPFWNRGSGAIAVEPNVFYETPGVGEFYLRPRRERRESVIEPYEYPVAGQLRLITTQVAPIFCANQCVGAAGLDVAVEEIPRAQLRHSPENPYETILGCGYVFLEEGNAGHVSYCSERSRKQLSRFIGPMHARVLPRRLLTALERLDKRDHGPSELHYRNGTSELIVHPFDHHFTGPGLVIVERTGLDPSVTLSKREREVLHWLREGKTNAEIAAILGISPHTVKRHVEKVLQKMDAPNRAAASARADQLDPEQRSA